MRNMDPAIVEQLQQMDVRRRAVLTDVERLKAERNAVSKEIGKMKDATARQEKIDAMQTRG